MSKHRVFVCLFVFCNVRAKHHYMDFQKDKINCILMHSAVHFVVLCAVRIDAPQHVNGHTVFTVM